MVFNLIGIYIEPLLAGLEGVSIMDIFFDTHYCYSERLADPRFSKYNVIYKEWDSSQLYKNMYERLDLSESILKFNNNVTLPCEYGAE